MVVYIFFNGGGVVVQGVSKVFYGVCFYVVGTKRRGSLVG